MQTANDQRVREGWREGVFFGGNVSIRKRKAKQTGRDWCWRGISMEREGKEGKRVGGRKGCVKGGQGNKRREMREEDKDVHRKF